MRFCIYRKVFLLYLSSREFLVRFLVDVFLWPCLKESANLFISSGIKKIMMIKDLSPGEKVSFQTRDGSWVGHVLPSHDPEIILLKLESGYNIGIRERDILDVRVLEKTTVALKKEVELKKDSKLKNVALVITGGTISSRLDPKTGGVISTDVEEILNIAPEIKEICNISKVVSPFMKLSENMSPSDWKKIAVECGKLLNDSDVDGMILTHGTDTLGYTGAALSFFIKDLNKPLAITYSQRSIDRGSTDANLNLVCAAHFAVSDVAEVAIIGHEDSNDEFCLAIPACRARKLHTSKRAAFEIVNGEAIARISRVGLEMLKSFNARDEKRKVKVDTKYDDKVAILKIYPGMDPEVIEYYLSKKYRGLVLEVFGLGQVPEVGSGNNLLPVIRKAVDKGVIVCATAGTIHGRLNPNVYSSGRNLEKTGIVFLEDMLSETAMVKLGWVLGHPMWKGMEREKLVE